MRITSIASKAVITILLGFLAWNGNASDSTNVIAVDTAPSGRLEISRTDNNVSVFSVVDRTKNRVSLIKSADKILRSSDRLIQLSRKTIVDTGDRQLFLLLARVPSSSVNPTGFCGAGHEDYLLLFSYKPMTLQLLDKKLIQSCRQSIALASDRGDDPADAVNLDENQSEVKLTWLSGRPDAGQEKTIRILGTRLEIR